VALGTCLIAGAATGARADNSTCANANLLVPDGSTQTGDIPAFPASGLRFFRFLAKENRSYAIMLENLTSPDQQAEIAVTSVSQGCAGPAVDVNDTADFFEPISYDAFGGGVGAARVALKSPGNQTLYFAINGHIDTDNASTFRVRVVETTLFGAYWTTTGGLETNYRIFNTTTNGGSCSVTLDLRRDDNSAVAAKTFSLGSNRSLTRHTGPSDMAVAGNLSGHATLTHNCPPGAIQVEAFLAGGARMMPLTMVPARQQR